MHYADDSDYNKPHELTYKQVFDKYYSEGYDYFNRTDKPTKSDCGYTDGSTERSYWIMGYLDAKAKYNVRG